MAEFTIEVSYGQIAVFDPRLKDPFNDWTDEHVAQGFAWRPASVSFGTLDSAGAMKIDVSATSDFDEKSSPATRVIAVPFTVPESGTIEIASIGDSVIVQMPPGEHELIYEHGRDAGRSMWAYLYFRPVEAPVDAKIVRADAELSPPPRLVMTASPA
jgi:hypothetical protein